MPTAGYSGTPLPKKLGIKPEMRVIFLNAPDDFPRTLGPLPDGVTIGTSMRGGDPYDVIVWFVDRSSNLRDRCSALAARLNPAGGLWIAWPKKSSGVAGDLSGDLVREIGLATGLVDNKICAVDETWSGLRFVIRVKNRPMAR
jgi:hypothetical protein